MSKYTITVKDLIKNGFVFNLNDYPIFDERYRPSLNKKILDHYLMSEIGLETPALFNHYLGSKLNEIMPYYNNLYQKQASLLENLDKNVNLTESFNRNIENETSGTVGGTSSSTSSNNSNSKSLYEDTPQGTLVQSTMENMTHASNINFNKINNSAEDSTTTSSSTTNNGTSTEDYIKTIVGSNGGKYNIDILKDIKNAIMNIDVMIINDLQDLFMGIL